MGVVGGSEEESAAKSQRGFARTRRLGTREKYIENARALEIKLLQHNGQQSTNASDSQNGRREAAKQKQEGNSRKNVLIEEGKRRRNRVKGREDCRTQHRGRARKREVFERQESR